MNSKDLIYEKRGDAWGFYTPGSNRWIHSYLDKPPDGSIIVE